MQKVIQMAQGGRKQVQIMASLLQETSRKRRIWSAALKATGFAAGLLLAACTGSTIGDFPGYPSGPASPQSAPQTTGQVIGAGSVRVAMLLPMSGGGSASQIGAVFRNTAELALKDFPGADVQILVKDTGGTAEGGRAAAQAAISEGAELILGPVFAPAVSGAGAVARSAGVPVVAFSTDTSVASRGIYLLSFLPQNDVDRIIAYAGAQGKRSFGALLPDDAYGSVTEAAFRQAVGKLGARIVAIERYKLTSNDTADLNAKINNLATSANQMDAIFIPQGAGVPAFSAQALAGRGVNLANVKLLGSGQWETPQVLNAQLLTGGWFAGPDQSGFRSFANRYSAAYGNAPPRNATLAYDATILAAGLVRSAGPERFSDRVLTNPQGFLGIDGVFRLLPSGLNQRGLAIYDVTGSGSRAIQPAPRSFAR